VPEVGLEPTLPGGNRIFESLWGPVEGPCVTFASATSTGGYPAYLSPFRPSSRRAYAIIHERFSAPIPHIQDPVVVKIVVKKVEDVTPVVEARRC
jgi:hypothetical protein